MKHYLQAAGTRKPLLGTFSGVTRAALRLSCAQSYHRAENGVGGRSPALEG